MNDPRFKPTIQMRAIELRVILEASQTIIQASSLKVRTSSANLFLSLTNWRGSQASLFTLAMMLRRLASS
jgi:hypothetical protein